MKSLFEKSGAHVLVDGQYGSTGKGALAAWLAHTAAINGVDFFSVVSNAGPNSGHTFYHDDRKIVLKQLPTFAVASHLRGKTVPVFLSSGAIIDPEILFNEAYEFPDIPIIVHPMAAVVSEADKASEHTGTVAAVAGTRSGAGAALARKVLRDPTAVWATHRDRDMPPNIKTGIPGYDPLNHRLFLEVSQGFSLGINQRFYPKVTSRICTSAQALADAEIPPRRLAKTYMTIRTFPIRVGNVDGHSSGGWYHDQEEISWDKIGVKPELTTVTQRPRRIATFSMEQFTEACLANEPDWVFVNFLNYLSPSKQEDFLCDILENRDCYEFDFELIEGRGPKSADIQIHGTFGKVTA
jgi:adenylosuccinate synthase